MATAAAITEQKWPFRLKSKANCGQTSKQYLTLLFLCLRLWRTYSRSRARSASCNSHRGRSADRVLLAMANPWSMNRLFFTTTRRPNDGQASGADPTTNTIRKRNLRTTVAYCRSTEVAAIIVIYYSTYNSYQLLFSAMSLTVQILPLSPMPDRGKGLSAVACGRSFC